jgi:hypothetical protein
MNDKNFDEVLAGDEKRAWEAFKWAVYSFVGRLKASNC